MHYVSIKKDVLDFIETVKRYVFNVVEIKGWNHVDFLYAIDVKNVIYKKLIKSLNKF